MSSSGYRPGKVDGDEAAKALDKGANAAMPNVELASGIHETAARGKPAAQKTSGLEASAFHSSGTIGNKFTAEGALGGAAKKIGGPFHEKGTIGKQFTDKGSIGGSVQDMLGEKKKPSAGADHLFEVAGRNSSR
ncbi:hypothetical protein F5X99DRAFT_169948 [Biscogniauxia marginata]|nr:hypothetical protein F5X99DRAFT_169948 [Biscogniauxia marginata]